jgi:hypothetical protein
VLRFVNLFCSAMLSGGMVLSVVALRPALGRIPVAAAILAQQLWIPRMSLYLPLCGALSAISAVFLVKRRVLSRASARFYLIGVACTLLVGLLSLYVGAVLDPDIAGWAATAGDEATRATFAGDGPPASVHGLVWNRWDAINLTRTLAAVAALTSFILANVQRRVFDREG